MTKKEYIDSSKLYLDANKAYHGNDNPTMTDEEFDKLGVALRAYEQANNIKHSVTAIVGFVTNNGFDRFRHTERMWSQEDIFSEEELQQWVSKFPSDTVFITESKYDGLSLKLYYNDGVLTNAVTRGDGLVGEDVYANALLIDSIPKTIDIKDKLDISGEIVMHNSTFNAINKQREINGEKLFANPRNAAAGTLRSHDSVTIKERELHFYPWDTNVAVGTHTDKLELFKDLGMLIQPLTFRCENVTEVKKVYYEFVKARNSFDAGLDGMMIKLDDVSQYDKYGYTSKFPKWSCAFKFPAVEKVTKLLSIVNQVGKSGTITPVAILEPVLIDGSTVSKATLHNYCDIERKGMMIGDYVTLIKSGDIIPKLIGVLTDRRTGDEKPITRPLVCPSCNQSLEASECALQCTNQTCPDIMVNKLVHFCSRDAMDISGVGPSVAKILIDHKLVVKLSDIYLLTKESLSTVKELGTKGITNLLAAIDKTIHTTFDKVLYSIGYNNIGRTLTKAIVKNYGLDILDIGYNDVIKLDKVGDVLATTFVNFIKENRELINDLIKYTAPTITIEKKGKLTGSSFVLTGTMSVGRDVYKQRIVDAGGAFMKSVTKDTTYLVSNTESGSKYKKAVKLGTHIITEDDMVNMLEA